MLPERMPPPHPKKPSLTNFVLLRRWKAFFTRFLTPKNARKPIKTGVTSYQIDSNHQAMPITPAFRGEIISA